MHKLYCICLLFTFNIGFLFGKNSVHVSLSPGLMGGEAVYQTGGTYAAGNTIEEFWFPFSKLEFPVFNIGGAVTTKLLFNRFHVSYSYGRYFNSNAGDLIDSDYGITVDGYKVDPNELTIYSQSLTSSDSRLHHLDVLYQVDETQNKQLFIGLGLRHDYLYFQSKNTYQTHPGSPEKSDVYVDGDTITYEVKTLIPLFLVQYIQQWNKVNVDITLGLSPFARSNEVDDHLVRGRRAEGRGFGTSFLCLSEVTYKINENFSYFLTTSFSSTDLSGRYENYFYNDSNPRTFSIDFRSNTTLYSITMGCYYNF